MKKFLAVFLTLGLVCGLSVGLNGCKKDDKTAKDKDKKDHKLEVSADPAKESAKPGDTKTAKLTLKRGKDTAKEVKLAVAVEPKEGIDASTDPAKTEKDDATLTMKVDAKAKEGDYVVTVTASAKDSPDAKTTVTVKVAAKEVAKEKKDKLTAVTDSKSITVKQGDKGSVKLTVTLGDDLKKGAALKAWVKDKDDKEAKLVTASLDHKTLTESGDAKVTVMADEKAAPGDYELTIETSAEGGSPASIDRKVTVKVDKK